MLRLLSFQSFAMINTEKIKTFLLATSLLFLFACNEQQTSDTADTGPAARTVVETMLANMGGLASLRNINSIVMFGNGTRNRLGQIPVTGGMDPDASLSWVTETIDFVSGHAAFDNDVVVGEGFSQHRTEALTTWQGQKIGWATTEGRPNIATSVNGLFSWATQNTPEMLLRRNPVSIAIAADGASQGQTARQVSFNSRPHWAIDTLLNSEQITIMIDQETGLLGGFTALDTETMLGDVDAEYRYSDYRPVGEVMLPFRHEIIKDGQAYSSMNYTEIRINDPSALAVFTVPEDITQQADQAVAAQAWAPLQWNQVSETVFHVVAFSHHSMVVEFSDFVAIIEGPYTEAQSMTLERLIEDNIGKPIRYVIPTHPHYDHTGGLRGLAAAGASVLTAAGHEDEIRAIIESPHSNPPDALALRVAAGVEVGQVELFSGMTEISNGDQSLYLYEVETIPHVNPKVLAFVEADGILFQSDLFFGGPGPDATALFNALQELELEVTQIVGGHGGILPYASLLEANAATTNN
ncbi:MBL fold metallo-hydrolase [Gammaproteobacteria bacterium]|nr:MBL fold metallo-hydrolase [Gammaproteobacteria bacterium]